MESTARWTGHPRLWVTAWLLAGVIAALVLPAAAQAHGPVDPAASSYEARVSQVPQGTDAKIVDGDLRMWMTASPTTTGGPRICGSPAQACSSTGPRPRGTSTRSRC